MARRLHIFHESSRDARLARRAHIAIFIAIAGRRAYHSRAVIPRTRNRGTRIARRIRSMLQPTKECAMTRRFDAIIIGT
ncbi:hypothetical protein, partial [Pseudomonas sp. 79_C]|uniref:hypothetical protein n=1 Tax=Pseudomonas sp. 79_C TaxID=2813567 RepID=UPI001A9FCE5A